MWLDEPGQPRDFPAMIGAQLDYRETIRTPQPHQSQRCTDIVVEIAVGRENRSFHPEDRCQHLFDGGLAVATGYRGNRKRESIAPNPRPVVPATHVYLSPPRRAR